MISRWNDIDELEYAARRGHKHRFESDVLRQAYATTLLGADNDLTMHGGGNTSVKTVIDDGAGNSKRALFVKSSGTPLNAFTPDHFAVMDLEFLEGLSSRDDIDDETMAREFKSHLLTDSGRLPSIETLMHAFIPAKAVAHTHPAAILKIVNRINGCDLLKKCFGDELVVIPYTKMGLDTAKAVSEAARQNPQCKGVVICHHGLVTWGGDAREAYDKTIGIVTEAEEFLSRMIVNPIAPPAQKQLENVIGVALLNTPDVMELINSPSGKAIITDPPLTPDYPMLSRISLVWVDGGIDGDSGNGIDGDIYSDINNNINGNVNAIPIPSIDSLPCAVVHPAIGALCFDTSETAAKKTADFVRQAFAIRRAVAETGGAYQPLGDEHLFDMQYRDYQQAKKQPARPYADNIAPPV